MTDMSVYMINSLLSINNALAFYELGVNQRLEMLQVRTFFEDQKSISRLKLMRTQKRCVMNRLLLCWLVAVWERFTITVRTSKKGMTWRRRLAWILILYNQARFKKVEKSSKKSRKPRKAMNQFDSYLSQPDGHQLPQFGLLSSPIIRDKIIKKVWTSSIRKKKGKLEIFGKKEKTVCFRAANWWLRPIRKCTR